MFSRSFDHDINFRFFGNHVAGQDAVPIHQTGWLLSTTFKLAT